MMHTCVFNGDIRRLSLLSVRYLEKMFESHLRLLYFWHVVPLANRHPKLSRPMDYYVGGADFLKLRV